MHTYPVVQTDSAQPEKAVFGVDMCPFRTHVDLISAIR